MDGHYSGEGTAKGQTECPILEALQAIKDNGNLKTVILIDNARLFLGENDYPSIESLNLWTSQNLPDCKLSVEKILL